MRGTGSGSPFSCLSCTPSVTVTIGEGAESVLSEYTNDLIIQKLSALSDEGTIVDILKNEPFSHIKDHGCHSGFKGEY